MEKVAENIVQLYSILQGHSDRVWKICFHPTSNPPLITSCSGDKSIKFWKWPLITAELENDLNNSSKKSSGNKCLKSLDLAHTRTVRSIAWNPDGLSLTSASFDASSAIWELQSRPLNSKSCHTNPRLDDFGAAFSNLKIDCIATLEGHENEVKSVAWSPSGNLLATCSRDKSVWIWQAMGDGDFECVAVLQEHTQDVKSVIWHPHEEILVSTSYDDSLKIWKEDSDDDWYCVQTLHGHSSTVWAADFDSSGELIASVGDDKVLYLWKRNSDTSSLDMYLEYAIFPDLHSRTIYSVSFKFPYIATCGGDNCIKIIEICKEQDTEVKIVERHNIQDAHGKSDVNSVVWCEIEGFRDYLCSAGDDKNIKIWHCALGRESF